MHAYPPTHSPTPPQSCVVVREGEMVSIDPAELVEGDVVCIEGGDNVPADVRITKSQNMKVTFCFSLFRCLSFLSFPFLLLPTFFRLSLPICVSFPSL